MKKIIGFIIFIALVSLSACTKDTDEVKSDSFAQTNVEDWFNKTFKNSKEWKENIESPNKFPDWSKGTYLKKDSLEVFEFPLEENYAKITIPKDKSITAKEANKIINATLFRLVIVKNDTNMIVRKLYYVPTYNYLQSKGGDISDVMLGKENDNFTGLLITKNWNDEVLSFHNVIDGVIDGMLVKKDTKGASTAKVINELDEVIVMNRYQQQGNPIFITPPPPYYYLPPITPIDPYKTGGGGTMTNPTAATAVIAQSIENKIDPTKLDPCLQGVYNQLKNATNSDIKSILEKLGAKNIYTVNMVMGNTVRLADFADTKKIAVNNYQITFAQDKYTSATKLYKAQAMLHEITHAFFRSLVDDANNFPMGSEPFVGFPILYQKYCETGYPGGKDVDHDQIANKYVNAIASALQEYDANDKVPYQVYTDLVWGGLRDTPDYDRKTPEEKKRIIARFQAEQNGVYSDGQYAVGKKCN